MKLLLFVTFLFCCTLTIHAQQAVSAVGGNYAGSSRSLSYTLGQIAYISTTNNFGETNPGEQQPYEILVISDLQFGVNSDLQFSVYPNPTAERVTIRIENYDLKNLNCSLYKTDRTMLTNQKIKDNETIVPLDGLTS
jgi:hypothetical protein